MARKRKNNGPTNNGQSVSTDEMLKKVKTLFAEVIVREWLNTPVGEWKGLTPLAMIRKGDGQKILDAIKKAEEEMRAERNPKKENKDERSGRHGPDGKNTESGINEEEPETILSRI